MDYRRKLAFTANPGVVYNTFFLLINENFPCKQINKYIKRNETCSTLKVRLSLICFIFKSRNKTALAAVWKWWDSGPFLCRRLIVPALIFRSQSQHGLNGAADCVVGLDEKPVDWLLQLGLGDWQSKVTLSFPQPFKGLQSSSLFCTVCLHVTQ